MLRRAAGRRGFSSAGLAGLLRERRALRESRGPRRPLAAPLPEDAVLLQDGTTSCLFVSLLFFFRSFFLRDFHFVRMWMSESESFSFIITNLLIDQISKTLQNEHVLQKVGADTAEIG